MTARRALTLVGKASLTAAVFYVLLSHPIDLGDGHRVPLWQVLNGRLHELSWRAAAPYLAVALLVKVVGIGCAMGRWHLLLIGQGIRFNGGHVVGSFLIGRFLGTFLPGTVGLDGYKLYDAARYSGRVAEPAAATAVEKIFGFLGIVLTFLVTLPLGYRVLGEASLHVVCLTVPLGVGLVVAGILAVRHPGWVTHPALVALLPRVWRGRVAAGLHKLGAALATYAGQSGRLAAALGLSFMVHFCTAAMYYFTALAVGAGGAAFFEVVFASSIQIFATVISPLTIAGEGVREVVQALLLAKRLGLSESILSAALGFWCAEALTLVGAFVWWYRAADYRPRQGATQRSVLTADAAEF